MVDLPLRLLVPSNVRRTAGANSHNLYNDKDRRAGSYRLSETIRQYNSRADEFVSKYELLSFEQVHGDILEALPSAGSFVLDVGCGSGRDAAWFAHHGYHVVAIDPAQNLLKLAQQSHPEPEIIWLQDKLPGLEQTIALGRAFDLILVSAVWMHIHPSNRARAFRKLVSLLKPGGTLIISYRNGGFGDGREDFPISFDGLQRLAMQHGIGVKLTRRSADRLERPGVEWETVVLQLPDDGTEALPLLRHITLNDSKSSTYKIALLRVLVRIADSATGIVRNADDDYVSVPLGLVALYWIRMYKPLLDKGIPQKPASSDGKGLGFVKEAFSNLNNVSAYDLRVGGSFSGAEANWLRQALIDARDTIKDMPAFYIKYPNSSEPIFKATGSPGSKIPRLTSLSLNEQYLNGFGELRVPRNLWNAFSRYASWIEPALVSEWIRLMQSYYIGRATPPSYEQLMNALVWLDPIRDTNLVRTITQKCFDLNQSVFCVWTGKKLQPTNCDIDHCFPFAAWPCNDLWNLMPTHRDVNQKQKGDKLVSASTLDNARERMLDWWNRAYASGSAFEHRFLCEASATLPMQSPLESSIQLESVFDGVALKRLILKRDLQITDWVLS